MWRGGVRTRAGSGPFGFRGVGSVPVLRFHIPLFKPNRRFSRIRLPDKESRFRPREVTRAFAQTDESQLLVEIAVGVARGTPTLELVLAA
jgi:hypothetical protein